jgi:hypothetical protein
MKMLARLLCLLLLLPGVAQAQTNTWSVTLVSGAPVMGEAATLTFDAQNASTSTVPISQVVFGFPEGYTIQGGEGPPGWVAWRIDSTYRIVAFRLDGNACRQPYPGLYPGETGRFQVRVVAPQAGADVTDALVGGYAVPYRNTNATEVCRGRVFTAVPDASTVRWTRHGLSARLDVSPRSLALGRDTAVQLSVTNRSSQAQSGIRANGPWVVGDAAFNVVSPFSPASLTLAPGQTGVFLGTWRAMSSGTSIFQASGSSATSTPVSSPVVSSLQVSAGPFGALADLSPLQLLTGDTATVRLYVTNPSSTAYTNIRPRTPIFQGTATATLVSGPTPPSLTSLAPGASASFTWQYRISGAVRSTYQFRLQADASVTGGSISTPLVSTSQGTIDEHGMSISPLSVRGGSSGQSLRYSVYNGGGNSIRSVKLYAPDPAFFTVSATPFASDTSGWTTRVTTDNSTGQVFYEWTAPNASGYIVSGQRKTFTLDYAAIGAVSVDTVSTHTMQLDQGPYWMTPVVEAPVTLVPPGFVPEVQEVTALAGPGQVTLNWTPPAEYDGVLVVRSTGAPPDRSPEPGRWYNVGQSLGNATVIYMDERSVASSLVDSGLTNGTPYHYRIFNHDTLYQYAAGNAPTSQGIKAVPTARGPGEPLWCYSVGTPALLQPITEVGVGIFSGNNGGTLTANLTNTSNPLVDGAERWRPVRLQGAVQSRFPLVPLHGLSGQYLFTGDQAGYTYGINADTGQILWRGLDGQSLGVIQSFPVLQLYDYANAAYRTATPSATWSSSPPG